jgi:signal peptidase I
MEPTILGGELVLVNKAAYLQTSNNMVRALPIINEQEKESIHLFNAPERGDIIVFYNRATDEYIIKRLIGLPEDTIAIQDGHTFINGTVITEPYVENHSRDTMHPVKLHADQYFVMGDNRPFSRDSRATGPIEGSAIIGKSWLRFWPPGEFKFFNHLNPLADTQ